MFALVMKTGKGLQKWGDQTTAKISKSMDTAVKREGFLLSSQMKKEVRQGAPGGQSYPKLSSIARRSNFRFSNRKPYTGIGGRRGRGTGLPGNMIPIRYRFEKTGKARQLSVGVVGTQSQGISRSWKRIFRRQQEGFDVRVTDWKRKYLASVGSNISKRSKLRRHFFLRKETRTFHIPARPVVEPFWRKWEKKSQVRMSDNFHKKMAGERI